jgi:hypothetical protein
MNDGEYQYHMRRALQGDMDSLGAILMAYRPPVEHTVYVFLVKFRQQSYVEDLVQDTFCAAVAGFHRFDPVGATIYYWLMRIAENRCIAWSQSNQVLLYKEALDPIQDANGDIVKAAPVEIVTANEWAADSVTDHGRPPMMHPQSDPAKMRRSRPDRAHVGQGVGGGRKPSAPPLHVLRNRELYAAAV